MIILSSGRPVNQEKNSVVPHKDIPRCGLATEIRHHS